MRPRGRWGGDSENCVIVIVFSYMISRVTWWMNDGYLGIRNLQ